MDYKLKFNTVVICIGYTQHQELLCELVKLNSNRPVGYAWEGGSGWFPEQGDNYVKETIIGSKLIKVMYE